MASNRRRLQWNTRERLLSTDLNDATALIHANISDDIAAVVSGDLYKSTLPLSGVLAGGLASADGLSLNITLTPLIAFKNGTPSSGFDSPYLRIETVANTTIDLTPFVDGANDRWVCIEVAPGTTQEVVSARDIFQPALGTFTPANVDKVIRSEPIFTVNAGTPAAAPQLPTGNPDVIPLAYVYIPAAAGSIATSDVIRCRPRFNSSSQEAGFFRGKGGLNVTAAGGTIAQLKPYAVKFAGQGFAMSIPLALGADANIAANPNWVNGETYPATDAPIFAYVMGAPYPPGYDTDVALNREYVDFSNRIPSVQNNPVVNGLIIWSTQEPVGGFAPVGAHPNGAVLLNDTTWNGGTSQFHSYVGAVSAHVTNAPAGLATQLTRGDRVRITEQAKLSEDFSVQSNSNILGAVSALANLSPLGLNNQGKGVGIVLPSAYEYDVLYDNDNQGAGGSYFFQVDSAEEPSTGPANKGRIFLTKDDTHVFTERKEATVRTPLSSQITWSHSELSAGTNIFRLIVVGYQDRFLALR